MNLAFYHVLFDRCCDEFVPLIGCGPDYRKRTNHTIFAADARVRYRRELNLGDTAYATLRLLNFDAKRIHLALELFHQDGWLSTTSELLWLHIDQSVPKVADFPPDILTKIESFRTAHAFEKVPEWIGIPVAGEYFGQDKAPPAWQNN
jgi:acyl-CoA thioester hydrolase